MTVATAMRNHVERFVAMKRRLGFRFTENARVLLSFARCADGRSEAFVRCATVLEWALRASTPGQRVKVLRMACDLANWLHAEDVRHEVPHRDLLGHSCSRRPTPCLISIEEIKMILAAARQKNPSDSINPLTWHCLFGLIAATGLRLGEALELTFDDLTCDGLAVRDTKFRKSRMVPLHETTWCVLNRYLAQRRRVNTQDNHLFVLSSTGQPPDRHYASRVFRELALKTGVRKSTSAPGPTIHSLRHAFATRSIEQMDSNADPGRHMLALSAYLGHAGVSSTYWYLESTPVLLREIADQVEQSHPILCGGCDD